MLETFLEAAIPEPVTCCGVRLRTFSLGHYFLLKRFCPECISESPLDFTGLLSACLICSQEYQQAIDTFSGRNGDLAEMLKDWGKRLSEDKEFNIVLSAGLFKSYINRAIKFPTVQSETKATWGVKNDPNLWPLITVAACMARLHQSFETVMNQPLSLSRWLVAGVAELDGNVTIIDPKALADRQAAADAFDAEFRAKGGGNGS